MSKKANKNAPELRFPEFKDNWLKKSLGEVCNRIQDGNYGESYPKSDEFIKDGIPFLTSKVIGKNGEIIKSKIDYISPQKHTQLSKAHLSIDDVLFTNRGANVGVIGFVDRSISNGNIGPQLTLLRSNKNIILPIFLRYYMNTYAFQKQVHSQDSGSAMNFFGIGATEKFIIYISTIAEQEKVASFLRAVDRRLAQLRRKQELLQTYKRGVMQKIFSQEIRFKGAIAFPFPAWERKIFGDMATKISSKYDPTNSDTNYPCIELESIEPNTGKLIKIFNSEEQQSIKSKFRSEDVLFGKLRPYLRKFAFSDFEGVCSTEIWVLRGKLISSKYLYYLVQSHKFYKISNVSFGSKMPRSDWDFVSNFLFEFPCKKEQEKIANFLTAIDRKIETLSRKIEQTEQFKKGLLQKMFV
ncbi:MAG: restriction endonuclease subunit S [Nostoc sp. NMS7]|uniref:restriction endonuclease subunit S n=1 Tax=Nostoc sp. NMS7 TaxID=2815391 RepID=UPI0025EA0364|nr:restriction endonuclease subunit S [Nostoc sp. NMS7]MBN3948477.1 restriction endonuclease subunit S [Nostoc sp. NMS7]